jgi:hypothetical protein
VAVAALLLTEQRTRFAAGPAFSPGQLKICCLITLTASAAAVPAALFAVGELAALDLYGLVVQVGSWRAPGVMAALAGVIHDRERAAGTKQNNGEEDQ